MRQKLHKILITGGAGFIGSEFARQAIQNDYPVIIVDRLTYAGDQARLNKFNGRYKFYKVDICDKKRLQGIFRKEAPDIVVHFAAETHVDRSIHQDLLPFLQTNIRGTQNLIDISRAASIKKFIHVSTDEVYGQITQGSFSEDSPLQPNNPYSATKAAADHLIRAAIRTYDFPATIVRPSNNYGYWQYPEKLIPVIIVKALRNKKIPIYGEGENIREWLHVSDCASAILLLLDKGEAGEIYNVGGNEEQKNIYTVKKILNLMGKSTALIQFVKDRPGHDLRYSLNSKKIHHLGWRPKFSFDDGLADTVGWYIENNKWLEKKITCLESYWKKIYQKA
ncbi:MAG: dTDP-glucose 4,6-dehydratase [Candidatus Omnitrophota bacterium]